MEWHCASFWDHILNLKQINTTLISKKILDNCVAIPIWLKKSVDDYHELGMKLQLL